MYTFFCITKKGSRVISLLLTILLLLAGCRRTPVATEDEKIYLEMNTSYALSDSLPDGNGKPLKVILLLGQSNASGASINAYLQDAVGQERYAQYEHGFSSVLINFCP